MKAIILAAGAGSRLGTLTRKTPKTLLNVGGGPILGHALDALLQNGITRVVLCVGFKKGQIVRLCRSRYPKIDFTFVENSDYRATNNMYSLYLARKHLRDDVVLMNADVIFDPRVVARLLTESGTVIAATKGSYRDESMKISTAEGLVTGIAKTFPRKISFGCSADIYKLNNKSCLAVRKEIVRIVERERNRNAWTEVALDALARRGELLAKPHDLGALNWLEVDTPDDLRKARGLFKSI